MRRMKHLEQRSQKGRLGKQLAIRTGLSLMEVILAIALLGTSLVVIYQLVNIGYRSAIETKIRTDANIALDTKMAEVASGALPLESTAGQDITELPGWMYSVMVESTDTIGLMRVTVTVEQTDIDPPTSISVVRFMPDPDYDPLDLLEVN